MSTWGEVATICYARSQWKRFWKIRHSSIQVNSIFFPKVAISPILPFFLPSHSHNCRDISSCNLHLHRLTCSENIDHDIWRVKLTWASWKFTWQFTCPFTLTGITSMKTKSIYSGRPPNCHTRVVVTCSI